MNKLEPKNNCPMDGFKPCRQLECGWFVQLRGTNPQTGEAVDSWGCAVAWMPMLLIEGAQQSRQTGAAVESFRNEMVASNANTAAAFLTAAHAAQQLKKVTQ